MLRRMYMPFSSLLRSPPPVASLLAVSTGEKESALIASVAQLFPCWARGGWGVRGGVLAHSSPQHSSK